VKTPHVSSKPPRLNLGNRNSTNRVLGTTPAQKGQATTKLEHWNSAVVNSLWLLKKSVLGPTLRGLWEVLLSFFSCFALGGESLWCCRWT